MTISNEMTFMVSRFQEYRSTIASFAALICGAIIFLWISRGTQFYQLAVGIAISAIALAVALLLFEFCWRLGLFVATFLVSENRN